MDMAIVSIGFLPALLISMVRSQHLSWREDTTRVRSWPHGTGEKENYLPYGHSTAMHLLITSCIVAREITTSRWAMLMTMVKTKSFTVRASLMTMAKDSTQPDLVTVMHYIFLISILNDQALKFLISRKDLMMQGHTLGMRELVRYFGRSLPSKQEMTEKVRAEQIHLTLILAML